MNALLLLLAMLLQPVHAPCPDGVGAYPLTETYEDGSAVVGMFCDTGSEGPSMSFHRDAETGSWSLDLRSN
jgi:hypothetical protein